MGRQEETRVLSTVDGQTEPSTVGCPITVHTFYIAFITLDFIFTICDFLPLVGNRESKPSFPQGGEA
jgi:hypothetical protein